MRCITSQNEKVKWFNIDGFDGFESPMRIAGYAKNRLRPVFFTLRQSSDSPSDCLTAT